MKSLSPEGVAAIEADFVGLIQMIKFLLPSPVCLNTSNWDFVFEGDTYRGAYNMGRISQIEDSHGEIKGLQLEMAGSSSEMLSLALDDARVWQRTEIQVRSGIIGLIDDVYTLLDAPLVWSGVGDTLNLQEEDGSSIIQATAESKSVDYLRGHLLSYSDVDQQMLYPGDLGMNLIVAQSDRPVVWPTKEFFFK